MLQRIADFLENANRSAMHKFNPQASSSPISRIERPTKRLKLSSREEEECVNDKSARYGCRNAQRLDWKCMNKCMGSHGIVSLPHLFDCVSAILNENLDITILVSKGSP